MRFLVDNALSPRLAVLLQIAGHDAVHVLARGLEGSSDREIIELAAAEERAVITVDADFSRILALGSLTGPSLLLLRGALPRRSGVIANLVLTRLPAIAGPLERGSIVLITPDRTRIRELPITPRGGA